MGFNTSAAATTHYRAILNAALESEDGITIKKLPKAKAIALRAYLHAIRAEDRKRSKKMYPDQGDPNHGRSAYDCLVTDIIAVQPISTILEEDKAIVNIRITKGAAMVQDLSIEDNVTGQPVSLEEYE